MGFHATAVGKLDIYQLRAPGALQQTNVEQKKIIFRIELIKTLVYVSDNRMDDACQDP